MFMLEVMTKTATIFMAQTLHHKTAIIYTPCTLPIANRTKAHLHFLSMTTALHYIHECCGFL